MDRNNEMVNGYNYRLSSVEYQRCLFETLTELENEKIIDSKVYIELLSRMVEKWGKYMMGVGI